MTTKQKLKLIETMAKERGIFVKYSDFKKKFDADEYLWLKQQKKQKSPREYTGFKYKTWEKRF